MIAAVYAVLLALLLGGCASTFCHSLPLLGEPDVPKMTTEECLQGFKEREAWLNRPVAAPGACPGTSVWNGVGCTTPTPRGGK